MATIPFAPPPSTNILGTALGVIGGIQGLRQRQLANKLAQMQQQYYPQEQQALLTSREAQAKQAQLEQQFYPQQQESILALRKAQTARQQQLAQTPFAGQMLPGAAGQIQALQILAKNYGVDSEQYKMALAAHNADLNMKDAKARYYGANTQYKNLTPTQKLLLAQHENSQAESGGQGSEPGSPMTYQPQQNSVLQAALQKRVSDAPTRQRAIASGEILDTLNKVNFTPIAQYTGVAGNARLKADQLAVSAGAKPSPQYAAYQNFVKSESKLIGDSVRQALATSVRSDYVKTMLMPLADPTSNVWGNDPALAIQRFNFFRNWVQHYHDVYRHATNYGVTEYGVQRKRVLQTLKAEEPKTNLSKLSDDQLLAIARGQ